MAETLVLACPSQTYIYLGCLLFVCLSIVLSDCQISNYTDTQLGKIVKNGLESKNMQKWSNCLEGSTDRPQRDLMTGKKLIFNFYGEKIVNFSGQN